MIVPNQQNIKVHFAAAEQNNHFCELQAGGVNYMLFTAFPLICQQFGLKTVPYGNEIENAGKTRFEATQHCIMDSGLFTLMFGSHGGKKDKKFIYAWFDALVDYVRTREYPGTMVEVDCQKVLGVKQAWELRKKLRDQVPNRVINVFHKEDGQKGLDRLIEFSDYIAISVPELRSMGQKSYTTRLAHYIKNRKPEIDIHLLGCTDQKILKELKYCSSCDSTSWNSAVRYGQLQTADGQTGHVSSLKKEHFMPFMETVLNLHRKFGVKIYVPERHAKLAFQAHQYVKFYEKIVGPQN